MTVNGQVASTTLDTSGAATVGSTLDVTSDFTVGATSEFVVTAADGNTATSGSLGVGTTLGVTGAATLSSTLGVTGLTTLAAVDVGGDVDIGSGNFVVTASNGDTAIAGTLSAGATSMSSVAVTGAASIGGAFATAYAEVTSSAGSTASCPDGKSVCSITTASGTDGSYTVVYGGSPVTGLMVFVRNNSGVDTAYTAFGTDKAILKNTGALFVYSGTAWMKIL
jgi:hypothetical protein